MTLICPECLGTMRYSHEDAMYICSHCGHEDDGLVEDSGDGYSAMELACTGCMGPCGACCEAEASKNYVEDGVPF